MKRLMIKYLGEMEEEDLIMFVLEHLKDHKSPQKLIEGLEPVRLFFFFVSVKVFLPVAHYTLRDRSWKRKLLN